MPPTRGIAVRKPSLIPQKCQISLLAALVVSATACGDGGLGAIAPRPAPTGSETVISGGRTEDAGDDEFGSDAQTSSAAVTFRFGMRGSSREDFLASTSDPIVIDAVRLQLTLNESLRQLHINGPIVAASKRSNMNWSWKYVESSWNVVELTFSLCDGRPSFVESDLQTWLALGQFCPAGSYVKREVSKPSR